MAFRETKFQVTRFNADAAPLPEGTRCVSIVVPDDDFFVRVLAAAYSLAIPKTNWEGEQDKRQDVSTLMEAAFEETDWEGCMDCAGVADCILNDETTQDALDTTTAGLIGSSGSAVQGGLLGAFPGIGQYTFPAGQPQSPSQLAADQTDAAETNPTCDNDILWAQALALTQATNRIIVDTLEKIESATNSVELADAASEFPLVGWLKDVSGGQAVLDLIQYWQNSVAEGYNAQYTTEIENQIACEIFCRGTFNGCQLTMDDVCNVMYARLLAHASIPPLSSFIDFLEFVTGLEVDGTLVVDLAFFTAWLGIKFGNFFFVEPFGDRFKLVCALAVNDANNDWELLCTDCNECGIDYSLVIGSEDFPPDIVSATTSLVTRIDGFGGTAYARRIELSFASAVTSVIFGYNSEGAGDDMYAKLGDGDTVTLPNPPASAEATAATPSTTFIVDLGYSGSSSAYAENPARITIVEACE